MYINNGKKTRGHVYIWINYQFQVFEFVCAVFFSSSSFWCFEQYCKWYFKGQNAKVSVSKQTQTILIWYCSIWRDWVVVAESKCRIQSAYFNTVFTWLYIQTINLEEQIVIVFELSILNIIWFLQCGFFFFLVWLLILFFLIITFVKIFVITK